MKNAFAILVTVLMFVACSSPIKHIGVGTGTDTTVEMEVYVENIPPATGIATGTGTGNGTAIATAMPTDALITTPTMDTMPTLPECKTQLTVSTKALSDDEKRITSTSDDAQRQILIRGSINSGCNAKYIGRMTISISNVRVSLVSCELHIGGMVFYPFVPSYPENIMFVFQEVVVVAAGKSVDYEIIAQTYSASSGATITTDLLFDDEGGRNFLWSDKSADVHSLESPEWHNGYGVNGLSTAKQVLFNAD
jgi:hypothetical protein